MSASQCGQRVAPRPTRPWILTRSSSAPAFPASISSTSCASSGCGCGCSRPAAASAAPGTGTAIPAPASIPKAIPTATRFRRSCWRSGIGPSASPAQPETERYLNHVADKFDLRRDIQFNSRVAAAHYHEETRSWDVALEDGRALQHALSDHRDRRAVGADHAAHPGRRDLPGPVLPYPLLAEGAGRASRASASR